MQTKTGEKFSFFHYVKSEFNRGYLLENDEERYTARREKVYAFFRIPLEIEKFFIFGFLQCADSFFYGITFLPIRFLLALWSLAIRSLQILFGSRLNGPILKPAETVDLIKVFLLLVSSYFVSFIDTSVYYHLIKTQSTIKLYLFFNMLEIADKLMSSFGQDTLDALFWTATESNERRRKKSNLSTKLFHLVISPSYVILHSIIVLMQALTLNVAINSDNKGLLTILISNNFVELKGAVFKKFDRNNLLQIACSDVRERFHYCVLLFVVVIQTMKEYSWKEDRLYILLPDCIIIFLTELMIDWLKHAFITRFNDIPITAYRDYNILIASDLIVCKQQNAYTDHSDLVARRMSFIPLPLTVVIYRVLSQALSFTNVTSYVILILGFFCLLTTRILIGITILGKACDLVESVEMPRSRNVSECVENSTPQIIRRRTVSKEYKDKVEAKKQPHVEVTEKTPEGGIPGISPFKDKVTELEKEEVLPSVSFRERPGHTRTPSSPDEALSMGFLGDSRSGLMANSMVDISSLGFTQAIVDADASDEGEAVLDKVPSSPSEEQSNFVKDSKDDEPLAENISCNDKNYSEDLGSLDILETDNNSEKLEGVKLRTSLSSPMLTRIEEMSSDQQPFLSNNLAKKLL